MGEESRSKKTRTKRASLPNSRKVREKIKKIKADRNPGITYAQKKNLKQTEKEKKKYDTEFGKEGMVLRKEKLGPLEIRYRALAKLLRQIKQLESKEMEGSITLDAQQIKKKNRKHFVEEELRQLIKKAKGDDEEEEEDHDDDDEFSDDDSED